LIDILDAAIDDNFAEPEHNDGDESLEIEEKKDKLTTMEDFGNVVRALLKLKDCTLDQAQDLAKEPKTKLDLQIIKEEHEGSEDDSEDSNSEDSFKHQSLSSPSKSGVSQDKKEKEVKKPLTIVQTAKLVDDKAKYVELIRKLGKEILPPPIITVNEATEDEENSNLSSSRIKDDTLKSQPEEKLIINVVNVNDLHEPEFEDRDEEEDYGYVGRSKFKKSSKADSREFDEMPLYEHTKDPENSDIIDSFGARNYKSNDPNNFL
jgi:hypothetical protein